MRTLCVDLAATFSAAMVLNSDREVLAQWDSRNLSAFGFAKTLRRRADEFDVDVLAIETLAPQMVHQVDRTYRLQGIIFMACHPWMDRMVLIQPQTWQKHWPGVGTVPKAIAAGMTKTQKDAYRIEQARLAALSLGYEAPNLVSEYEEEFRREHGESARILKKHTAPLAKNMTDYCDAFLIGDFVLDRGLDTLLQTQGVTPPMI